MDDLKLEESIAYLEGTAVHNCLSGGISFPSYLRWSLIGQLIVKYDCSVVNVGDGEFIVQCKMATVDTDVDTNLNRAILLAILEANSE
jgi:hypothetical protein